MRMQRRSFLSRALVAITGFGTLGRAAATTLSAPKRSSKVSIEAFDGKGVSQGVSLVDRIVKPDAEWRAQLSVLAFEVTRHEGTERPFSGEHDRNKADGLYHCICCGTPLFDSRTKFDSGTGWPSFWKPISKYNVLEKPDNSLGMRRIAVECQRCDAHLGHVFDDGPRPTGLRYCMNSVSLKFARRTA